AAASASSLSRVRGEGQGRCLTSLGVGRRIGAGTGRSSGASSKRSYEIDCGLQYCSRAARSWPKVFGVMTPEEEPVYSTLRALDIGFDRHEHPPVATAEEAEQHWAAIDAMHFKNLFLRNQKGTRHYLVIVRHLKRANLRGIADQLGDGKLSFASPERLMTHLWVRPGSVSPFGLIHDRNHSVRVAIDRDLKSADQVSF